MSRFLLLAALVTVVLATAILYDYPNWLAHRADRMFSSGNMPAALVDWSAMGRLPGRKEAAQFNSGVAAYRMGNYSAAAVFFQAGSATGDSRLRGRALYNLGTTRIRLAAAPGTGGGTAVAERQLEYAVRNLQASLALDRSDEAALRNLRVARARLATLLMRNGTKNKAKTRDKRARQNSTDAGEEKRKDPTAPGKDPTAPGKDVAKPGKATDMDREGGKKRRAPLDRNQALRMLDEARGREALRSATTSLGSGRKQPSPEKDW